MNLVNQVVFAILLSALTGTLALWSWLMIREKLFAWKPDLIYLALRCVCLMYVVPVGFVLIQLTAKGGYIQTDDVWQLNFAVTRILRVASYILAAGWLSISFKNLKEYMGKRRQWAEICAGNIPEEDLVAMEEFKRIKRRMRIIWPIGLYRNDLLSIPMITGVIRCNVLLPYRPYSREQLQVIFYHELTHFKSHDVLYKMTSTYILIVLHLSGCAEKLLNQLNEWSEYHCDIKAIKMMEKDIPSKGYFKVIIDIMDTKPDLEMDDYIFSMLCEGRNSLERRINYMVICSNRKRTAKSVAFVLASVFMTFHVSTIYAAGTQMAHLHDYLYKGTEELHQEIGAESISELVEHVIPAGEDNTYDELIYEYPMDDVMTMSLAENELVSFNWSITSGNRHVSVLIPLNVGNSVSISASTVPGTSSYWIGIMDTDGRVRYVEGKGSFGFTFPIDKKGNYRVLIQNMSDVKISSSGSYFYYTP